MARVEQNITNLIDALRLDAKENEAYGITLNGAKTLIHPQPLVSNSDPHKVSGRVRFYYKIVRNMTEKPEALFEILEESFQECPLDTLKLMFHLRNIKNGKGERKLFRMCCEWWVKKGHVSSLLKNVSYFIKMGRADDLFSLGPWGVEAFACVLLQDLRNFKQFPHTLLTMAAKWAPKEGNAGKNNIPFTGRSLLNVMLETLGRLIHHDIESGFEPQLFEWNDLEKNTQNQWVLRKKVYRQKILNVLRPQLNIVERRMCARQFDQIEYNKVPSKAMTKYSKKKTKVKPYHKNQNAVGSFRCRDPERFTAWEASLAKGVDEKGQVVKVNAQTLHPHEIVHAICCEYSEVLEAQWNTLLTTMPELNNTLVVVDTSGSMNTCMTSKSKVTPLEVAISLGMFCAQKLTGVWKNKMISFSKTPQFVELDETLNLKARIDQVKDMAWELNTNFQAVFELILNLAQKHQLKQEQLPKCVLTISDMQFDSADTNSHTNLKVIQDKFKTAGYQMPVLVFWNVMNHGKDVPATVDERGVVMVSGFSPQVLKHVTNVEELQKMTPWSMVQKVLNDPDYANVQI